VVAALEQPPYRQARQPQCTQPPDESPVDHLRLASLRAMPLCSRTSSQMRLTRASDNTISFVPPPPNSGLRLASACCSPLPQPFCDRGASVSTQAATSESMSSNITILAVDSPMPRTQLPSAIARAPARV